MKKPATNPASVVLDLLRGAGWGESEIDVESFRAAESFLDQPIDHPLLAFCVCTCCGATGLRWSNLSDCYRAPCSCSGFADKAGRCVKHGCTVPSGGTYQDSCRYVYQFDAEAQG